MIIKSLNLSRLDFTYHSSVDVIDNTSTFTWFDEKHRCRQL